jgi:hypothetical protein
MVPGAHRHHLPGLAGRIRRAGHIRNSQRRSRDAWLMRQSG